MVSRRQGRPCLRVLRVTIACLIPSLAVPLCCGPLWPGSHSQVHPPLRQEPPPCTPRCSAPISNSGPVSPHIHLQGPLSGTPTVDVPFWPCTHPLTTLGSCLYSTSTTDIRKIPYLLQTPSDPISIPNALDLMSGTWLYSSQPSQTL